MNRMNPLIRHASSLACAASLLLAFGTAGAATAAAKPAAAAAAKPAYEQQYATDKKAANDRYAADKKLCDEEKTASTRMQCRRDANDEYQQALAAAQKKRDEAKTAAAAAQPAPAATSTTPATTPATPAAATTTATPATLSTTSAAICNECGKVTAIHVGEKKGKGGPIGLIAGGVAGAVLGHQVGGGSGKDIATIAGAAGGAYAGHKIEEKMTSSQTWSVSVRFENGEERSYAYDNDPKFVVGDKVKVSMRFRGREMGYVSKGRETMLRFCTMVEDMGTIEKNPILEGRNMSMVLAPKSEKDREKEQKEKDKIEQGKDANQNGEKQNEIPSGSDEKI